MMEFDKLSNKVIGLCIEVHKNLGPGLLESTYAACLAIELNKAGIRFEKEKHVDIEYKGIRIESAYRADFIIEDTLLLELKSVEMLIDIHMFQILTYLKVANYKTGLLINFNVSKLKDGIKRFVI